VTTPLLLVLFTAVAVVGVLWTPRVGGRDFMLDVVTACLIVVYLEITTPPSGETTYAICLMAVYGAVKIVLHVWREGKHP
jgi:hypothetical protein